MQTLREINEDLMLLLDMMMSGESDPQTLADTFEGVKGERDEKLNGYATVRAEVKANVAKLDEEIARLQARKKACENNIKSLDFAVENSMRLTGDRKIKTDLYTFSIQKNGGKAPLILREGLTTDDVPAEFVKWLDPVIDNEAIKKALDEGKELEFAHYGERGESLRIR